MWLSETQPTDEDIREYIAGHAAPTTPQTSEARAMLLLSLAIMRLVEELHVRL